MRRDGGTWGVRNAESGTEGTGGGRARWGRRPEKG